MWRTWRELYSFSQRKTWPTKLNISVKMAQIPKVRAGMSWMSRTLWYIVEIVQKLACQNVDGWKIMLKVRTINKHSQNNIDELQLQLFYYYLWILTLSRWMTYNSTRPFVTLNYICAHELFFCSYLTQSWVQKAEGVPLPAYRRTLPGSRVRRAAWRTCLRRTRQNAASESPQSDSPPETSRRTPGSGCSQLFPCVPTDKTRKEEG